MHTNVCFKNIVAGRIETQAIRLGFRLIDLMVILLLLFAKNPSKFFLWEISHILYIVGRKIEFNLVIRI